MSEPTADQQLDAFLEIRKPGAHLEDEVVADDFVLMLGVDLTNYPKFRRVDDDVTYPRADLDIRQQLDVDSGDELHDRMRAEFLPSGTPYDDPNRDVPEPERPHTRVVYTGMRDEHDPEYVPVELTRKPRR